MKPIKTFCLTAVVLSFAIAGCMVASVYPFFHARDLVTDDALAGEWIEKQENSEKTWRYVRGKDKTYDLSVSDNKDETYTVALFTLKGHRFMDLLPDDSHGMIPPHHLFRVDEIGSKMKIAAMNYSWLKDYLAEHPKDLRHHKITRKDEPDKYDLVLTADTDELQAFILKHLNDKDAFGEPTEMARKGGK
jgi:hypothetical protein